MEKGREGKGFEYLDGEGRVSEEMRELCVNERRQGIYSHGRDRRGVRVQGLSN